jgi:molybdate transport system substrate-binding protein
MPRTHPLSRLSVFALLLGLLAACAGQPAAAPTAAPAPAPAAEASAPTEVPAATQAPAATPAPASDGEGGELVVFAAASLAEAFGEIGSAFERQNPSVTVTFSFAGSNQLAQQIAQGAPVDVFASANRAQMENVIESGEVAGGSERTFVRNRLVVITPVDNRAGVVTLADLANPGVKIVLAAREVPVGQYSLDFLAKAGALPEYTATYSETVLENVVSYEENVRAVLAKVALGEGDAGIVYTSDITGENAGRVARIEIPDALNTIATYPIAPIVGSERPELARRFVDYVLSAEGQAVLERYGFIPAAGS